MEHPVCKSKSFSENFSANFRKISDQLKVSYYWFVVNGVPSSSGLIENRLVQFLVERDAHISFSLTSILLRENVEEHWGEEGSSGAINKTRVLRYAASSSSMTVRQLTSYRSLALRLKYFRWNKLWIQLVIRKFENLIFHSFIDTIKLHSSVESTYAKKWRRNIVFIANHSTFTRHAKSQISPRNFSRAFFQNQSRRGRSL